MKISIYTLGCKVNQYETQAMEAELLARGHSLVPFEERADAYIINTCTVTAVSDKKSRQVIRRARKENPEAIIGVCGCYAQTAPEAVRALEVDLISGTAGRMAFLDDLEALLEDRRAARLAGEAPRMTVDDALRRRTFEELPAGGLEGRTRAMLKVEDGCVNFCSYCIIPYARGPVRSLPLAAAAEQTRQLRQESYREVVLTGIEISSWGQDLRDGSSRLLGLFKPGESGSTLLALPDGDVLVGTTIRTQGGGYVTANDPALYRLRWPEGKVVADVSFPGGHTVAALTLWKNFLAVLTQKTLYLLDPVTLDIMRRVDLSALGYITITRTAMLRSPDDRLFLIASRGLWELPDPQAEPVRLLESQDRITGGLGVYDRQLFYILSHEIRAFPLTP